MLRAYEIDRDEATRDANAMVMVTEWYTCRRALTPEHASFFMTGRLVMDGDNAYSPLDWRADGWDYRGMAEPDQKPITAWPP